MSAETGLIVAFTIVVGAIALTLVALLIALLILKIKQKWKSWKEDRS